MMRIAVCDDTPMEADFLRDTLVALGGANPPDVRVFGSGEALLAAVEAGAAFDLCFLDIVLPGMDGLELARRLRTRGHSQYDACPIIVFLSNSSEFTDAAASLGALAYLEKPVKGAALAPVLDAAAALLQERQAGPAETVVSLPDGGAVSIGQVAVLIREGRTARWLLADGRALTAAHTPFEDAAAPLLADPRFLRVGRRAVVNMALVQRLDAGGFALAGGTQVAVPRHKMAAASRAYMAFLAGTAGGRNSIGHNKPT